VGHAQPVSDQSKPNLSAPCRSAADGHLVTFEVAAPEQQQRAEESQLNNATGGAN